MFRASEKKLFSSFSTSNKRTRSEAMIRLDDPLSEFRKKNRHFQVWIPLKLMTNIDAARAEAGSWKKREFVSQTEKSFRQRIYC